jgi:hypothetical protein
VAGTGDASSAFSKRVTHSDTFHLSCGIARRVVKRKTKIVTGNINVLNGYRVVEIFNPMEVVENDDDK